MFFKRRKKKKVITEREMLEEMYEMYKDMVSFNHRLEACLVKRMDYMHDKMDEYEKLKESENDPTSAARRSNTEKGVLPTLGGLPDLDSLDDLSSPEGRNDKK